MLLELSCKSWQAGDSGSVAIARMWLLPSARVPHASDVTLMTSEDGGEGEEEAENGKEEREGEKGTENVREINSTDEIMT